MYTYTYDSANRLTSAVQGTNTYTFAYNGMGDRMRQEAGGITTTYTLDLNAGLTQVLADGTNTYLYGNGRIAQYAGTIPAYFLGDALGSVRQLTSITGTVTLAKSYQPYGSVLSSVGSGASIYGWTGEIADATGLTYLRSRYLSTSTGRFLSRDSWAGSYRQPLTLNKWNYVESDPVNRVDPRGDYDCATATVQSGDRMWRIWYNYARSHGFATPEEFYAANPQIQNPSWIWPGDRVYVPGYCPPAPAPVTPKRDTYFNGYFEGRGATVAGVIGVTFAYGIEVVYDFVHLHRATFQYVGDPRVKIGDVSYCGLGTPTGAGITYSAYAGVYHFQKGREDIRRGYEGLFGLFSASLNAEIPWPVPLPSPFGGGVEFNLFASLDPNVTTFGFPGIPDLNNVGWGASMGIHGSGGKYVGLRLPIGLSVVFLKYDISSEIYDYHGRGDAQMMALDILNGTYSEILGAKNNKNIPVLQQTRYVAAERLLGMYAP